LEYRADGYAVVDYKTASRNGEPFEALIDKRHYLPNTFARFCTSELKIVPMKKHLKSLGYEDITTFVGIRADEPRRVAKMKDNADIKETPLATAKVTVSDVLSFWDKQPFNLQTITVNGNSLLSNCDLCFLKKADHLLGLIQDKPERAVWWANMEKKIGARFNQAHPSYVDMLHYNSKQRDMFDPNEEAKNKSKRQKPRRHFMKNGRYYRRPLVIRPEDVAKTDEEKRQLPRQDADLAHVIISEKKDAKIASFQVSVSVT
jgi:3'-phosphoadenosine 5'-phosphosulfate sulfotransferase (PAPS reductase)/FAD synthetase